jgi:hypothetical protein
MSKFNAKAMSVAGSLKATWSSEGAQCKSHVTVWAPSLGTMLQSNVSVFLSRDESLPNYGPRRVFVWATTRRKGF